jgi:hypothetical protein
MLAKLSIRARLRLFCIILLGLTLGLAGAAFLAVTAIEKTTAELTVQHDHTLVLSHIDYLVAGLGSMKRS